VDALQLLREKDHHALFRQARELAMSRPTVTMAITFLDSNCSASPPCRHCIWQARERFSLNFRRRMTREEFVRRGVSART
jgi:hypothetical protein